MLDIPFPLETVPAHRAEQALEAMISDRKGVNPVLLGDRDVFSTQWAEHVDVFENPAKILAEARALDANVWFAKSRTRRAARQVELGAPKVLRRLAELPGRLMRRPFQTRDTAVQTESDLPPLVLRLKAQLAELEASGESGEEDLAEFRAVIAEIERDGADNLFPDPVDYVTPRHGSSVTAGLVHAKEPWESAAWLQHGTYAICVPKAVFVAHCRWLWTTYGARLITASADHVGFQMERPIKSQIEAVEVLRRFELLGATEVNGDHTESDGRSLLHAERLWVWWD